MNIMNTSKQKFVVVGMSGGVDSSVSALLLKEQGYKVLGIFMRNWEEQDSKLCSAAQDYDDVAATCAKIDIPFYTVDFSKEYKEQVFDRFVKEYEMGLTPNPDILCNREIKFKVFYDKAMELGADYIATGHYCQTREGKLFKGKDPSKDQSYFLYAIDGKTLPKVLFPIGHMLKSEVREFALKHGLPTHGKKDSTGICFVGERKFPEFLSQYVKHNPGNFCTLDGTVVGQHHGVPFYTLGQRKHLGLGGPGNPWYVVKKDFSKNIVYVEREHDHPELFNKELLAIEDTWISGKAPELPLRCFAKIRYRQKDQACLVQRDSEGRLHVIFEEPQRAVAPAQSIVFYTEEGECFGGAVILPWNRK